MVVDDFISLTASDADEWECSGKEPEAPPPSPSMQPSVDSELIRVVTHAVEELGLEWSAPEEPTPGLLDEWFLKGQDVILPPVSGQLPSCLRCTTSSPKHGGLHTLHILTPRLLQLSPPLMVLRTRGIASSPLWKRQWLLTFFHHRAAGLKLQHIPQSPAG